MKTIISNQLTKIILDLSFKIYSYEDKDIMVFSKLPIKFLKDLDYYWNSHIKFIKSSSGVIVNIDHIGSGRFFYIYSNNNWYITDDWRKILKKVNTKTLNSQGFEFYKKHGYFLFDDTIYNEIKRIPTGVGLEFVKDNRKYKFENFFVENNYNKFSDQIKLVHKNLFKNLFKIKKLKYKEINILASGGVDSFLLVKLCHHIKLKIKVHCTISTSLVKSERNKHLLLANYCIKNNINIRFYHLDTESYNILKKVKRFDPNIAHTYMLFDTIYKNLNKNDVCLVGQGVDSVYSYGPSNNRPISFLARQSLMSTSIYLKKIICFFTKFYFNINLSVPKNTLENRIAFLNHTHYFKFKNLSEKKINNYCVSILKKLKMNNISDMYLKRIGFLSGSDNSIFHVLDHIYSTQTIFPYLNKTVLVMLENRKKNRFEKYIGKPIIRYLYRRYSKLNKDFHSNKLDSIRALRKKIFFDLKK